MKRAYRTGMSFGVTSGIVTTMGLISGLHAGTHSRPVVLGGIVTIAVADALSDALGMHLSQEAEHRYSTVEIWQATGATFVTKFLVASTFAVPVLLLPLPVAMATSSLWGLALLAILSSWMARRQGVNPVPVVAEHVLIAVLVVIVTHLLGGWIGTWAE